MVSESEKIHAVVLAGGINRIRLYDGYEPGYKALLSFGDRPSIQFVLDALRQEPGIDRICVVGPEEEIRTALPGDYHLEFEPGGRRFSESFLRGLAHFHDAPAILFITADLPLVTPGAIANFLEQCRRKAENSVQLFFSAVSEETFTGPFRDAPKRCSSFRDMAICHGNLALLPPKALQGIPIFSPERLDGIYRSRKKTLQTCWAFGWPFLLGYLFGAGFLRPFRLQTVLRVASHHFSLEIVPIFLDHPGVALDIDEPQDYEFARNLLEKEFGGPGNTPCPGGEKQIRESAGPAMHQ